MNLFASLLRIQAHTSGPVINEQNHMHYSPLLLLHITGGTVGLISGFVTIALRKGSNRHRIAGYVFVAAMLTMSSVGAFMAIRKFEPGNILGGTLTFYLVATAAMVFRPRVPLVRLFDRSALLLITGVSVAELICAYRAATSPTGKLYGYPFGPYLIFGCIALLAGAGDLRMLLRSAMTRTQSLIRHLWRMCFGLFIAAASVFLARPHLFPAIMQKSGALIFLTVLPLLLMLFWFIRVRRSASRAPKTIPTQALSPS
jgi:hypothetical protein